MKIFLAFESEDRKIAHQFINHLTTPERNGIIELWYRDLIPAGANFSIETEKNLHDADLILFFLSADFLSSTFLYEIEDEVIRRVKKETAQLIPILIRPCFWESANFNELKIEPRPKEGAISSLIDREQERVIFNICQQVLLMAPQSANPRGGQIFESSKLKYSSVDDLMTVLRDLLANNRTSKVFDILDDVMDDMDNPDLRDTVILLKSRYNSANRDKRLGIVSNENSQITDNQILYSLLGLIDQIPEELKLRGVEESSTYLDAIKKTSGFEKDQKKYDEVRGLIFDRDQDIDKILNELIEDFEVESYPAPFQKYQDIKLRYERLIDDISGSSISFEDQNNLDKIRGELSGLVDDLQKIKSDEKIADSKEDFTTSDIVYLNEAKLILVGNGEVGKTTLRENLIDPNYRLSSHKSTDGLEVVPWEIDTPSLTGIEKFKLNIWDFGGQGKYRAIQQFFCTSQALYIFLTTPEEKSKTEDDNYTDPDYWLNFIKLFGYNPEDNTESSVIFVMNKADIGGNQDINQTKIQGNFQNVKDFIKVSCKSGMGLDELRATIEKRLKDTGMLNRSFPAGWMSVKTALQERSKTDDILNFDEYLNIFKENAHSSNTNLERIENLKQKFDQFDSEDEIRDYLSQSYDIVYYSSILNYWNDVKEQDDWKELLARQMLVEQEADVLIKYLHAIGVILYYPNVKSLQNKIILNPDWARRLAYEIMNSSFAAGGILKADDVEKILPGDDGIYSIDLLETYKLCIESKIRKDSGAAESTYFIPSLFPIEKPPGMIDFSNIPHVVQYRCSFSPIIPAEFLPRLLTGLFNHISRNNQFWKYGALLTQKDCDETVDIETYAQLEEDWRKNKLTVNLIGKNWDSLLPIIANEIYKVFEEIKYDNLQKKLSLNEELKLANSDDFISISEYRHPDKKNLLMVSDLKSFSDSEESQLTPEDQKTQIDQFKVEIDKNAENLKKSMQFLAACPAGKTETRITEEYSSIDKTIKDIRKENMVLLTPQFGVESENLITILEEEEANYIHFSLHGSKRGHLLFVREGNLESRVDSGELVDVFNELKFKPSLVCFSACHSYTHAEALAKFVPYTIGMKGFFPVEAAHNFSRIFYRNLFNRGLKSVEFSFKQALRALKQAEYPPQNDLEVHNMPYLFENDTLKQFKI